jgi:hypothetical protein
MKPSSERLQKQPVSYDDEPCNERKCANCFENRGCMYDTYITNASMEKLESVQLQHSLKHELGMLSGLHHNLEM